MSFSLGIRVYVKFRFLGITLGTFDQAGSVSVSSTGAVSFSALSGAPSTGVTTLVNDRGVVLQAWA